MPFIKPSSAELDRIAEEVLATLRRQDLHPMASTRGLTFSQIERTAHAVGQRVAARLTADTLAAAADEQPDRAACPKCQNSAPVKRKPREVLTHDGPVDYSEPAAYCAVCRCDFFPSASAVAPRRTRV